MDMNIYFEAITVIQQPQNLQAVEEKYETQEGFICQDSEGEIHVCNYTHNPDINLRTLAIIEHLKEKNLNQLLYSTIMTRFIAMGRFLQSPEGEKVGLLEVAGTFIMNPAAILASATFPVNQDMTFLVDDSYDSFVAEIKKVADQNSVLMGGSFV